MSTILLDDVDVDTTSLEFTFNQSSAILVVRADNFGSGTVVLEAATATDSGIGLRFTVFNDGTFTSNGTKKVDLTIPGLIYRARLFNSSGASNVKLEMI